MKKIFLMMLLVVPALFAINSSTLQDQISKLQSSIWNNENKVSRLSRDAQDEDPYGIGGSIYDNELHEVNEELKQQRNDLKKLKMQLKSRAQQ